MTRQEAIRELKQWRDQMKSHGVPDYGKKLISLDLAIEALQERKRSDGMSFIDSREKKDVRKQFLLTESNNHRLKAEAEKRNMSENELINKLIRELKNQQN